MSTRNRAEVSKKNPYYLPKHRFLELKHFCLQYPEWKQKLEGMNYIPKNSTEEISLKDPFSNATEHNAMEELFYQERINLVEETAKLVAQDLQSYILLGVTQELSYEYMKAKLNIPCCKDVYYNCYRAFFYALSFARK